MMALVTKTPPIICDLPTTTGNNHELASNACDEKGILFGRGKSIQERPPNIHFRKFVHVFRENYQNALFPSERHRIVQRIVEILRHDGYSFLKPCATTISSSGSNKKGNHNHNDFERGGNEEEKSDNSDIVVQDHSSWVPATPPEVHKKVTSLFRKSSPKRTMGKQQPSPAAEGRLPIFPKFSAAVETPVPALAPSPATKGTAAMAQNLLQQHLISSTQNDQRKRKCESLLPPNGIIWSEGTQSIRLLEGTDDGPIPISSYSLFTTAVSDAFGTDTGMNDDCIDDDGEDHDDDNDNEEEDDDESASASPPLSSPMMVPPPDAIAGIVGGIDVSSMPSGSIDNYNHKTIGYTQQKVGNLTILRPIVLLREFSR